MARRADSEEEEELEEVEEAAQEEEEEEEDDEDESDDEDLEKPLREPRRDAVYDTAGMQAKLGDFRWPINEVSWLDSLAITVPNDGSSVNAEDDLAREMSLYTLALEGSRDAYTRLQQLNLPFLRPDDYYAEMIKSDRHMLKVKDRLLSQKKVLQEQEERRRAREAKKFAKEVQAEKLKERAKQKKQDVERVKKWRKMRKDSDFTRGEEDFPVDTLDGAAKKRSNSAAPWDRSGGKAGKGQGNKGKGKKSREQRNAKFGNGGRKGLKKRNTAESSADMAGGGFKKGGGRGPSFKKQRTK